MLFFSKFNHPQFNLRFKRFKYIHNPVSEHSQKNVREISDVSPILYLSYFPLKVVLEKLYIKKYVDYFHITHILQFDLYELISSLSFARVSEIFTVQIKNVYGLDISKTYFECTNFYFKINREDGF